ncbi:NADH-ubiquinone oxidoreductase chain C [hydrothermal vent metagenome]|uniref:NADH-ubiquinone oxidoreductase chain C n=1 Tax=hydrothermal vent metagenome TaxID=652676 RepID=A0A1W1EIB9_9ZZZZ
MRKYVPKDNVQKKSYYTDRFWVAPRVPQFDIEEGSHFASVVEALGDRVINAHIEIGQLLISIKHQDNYSVLETLRDECGYKICTELSAVDYLAQDGEFEIFYQMLNLDEALRVRVVCRIAQGEAIETTVPLFKSANFAEREMYDMFGIKVNNHPFLKRLIMPDDWEGHPLLKTYPLQGDEFASWYEVDKIFGKEYRDVIGPENRDASRIDRYDTKRFSRVGYEVDFDADISKGESKTPIEYSKTVLVDYTTGTEKLDERR